MAQQSANRDNSTTPDAPLPFRPLRPILRPMPTCSNRTAQPHHTVTITTDKLVRVEEDALLRDLLQNKLLFPEYINLIPEYTSAALPIHNSKMYVLEFWYVADRHAVLEQYDQQLLQLIESVRYRMAMIRAQVSIPQHFVRSGMNSEAPTQFTPPSGKGNPFQDVAPSTSSGVSSAATGLEQSHQHPGTPMLNEHSASSPGDAKSTISPENSTTTSNNSEVDESTSSDGTPRTLQTTKDKPQRRKRGKYRNQRPSREAKKILHTWYNSNRKSPYLKGEGLQELAVKTGLKPHQVQKWMSNARGRTQNTYKKAGRSNPLRRDYNGSGKENECPDG